MTLLAAMTPHISFAFEFGKPASDGDCETLIKRLGPKRIDPAFADADRRPAYGVIVNEVAPGSPAEAAGLQKDWVIFRYNGEPYWDRGQPMPPDGQGDSAQRVEATSPSGETKTFHFKPGPLGLTTGNRIRPEIYLLSKIPRGSWDRDMMSCVFAWNLGAYEVTETLIRRSLDAGMAPSIITDYYGAMIAMERGDHAEAKALTSKFVKQLGEEPISQFYSLGVKTLAFQYHEFELLKRLLAQESFIPKRVPPAAVDAWMTPEIDPLGPGLYQKAIAKAGDNLMSTTKTSRDGPWSGLSLMDIDPLKDGVHAMTIEPNHHFTAIFAPDKPVRNLIWEATFAMGNNGRPDKQHPNVVVFGLMDWSGKSKQASTPGYLNRQIAKLVIGEDSGQERWTGFTGGPIGLTLYTQRKTPWMNVAEVGVMKNKLETGQPVLLPGGKKEISVALVRLGNEVEITVNQQVFLRLPIDPAVEDVGCYFQCLGCAMIVDGFSLREIKP